MLLSRGWRYGVWRAVVLTHCAVVDGESASEGPT